MAKILYGVHGTLHGHAVRALTLARRFREHTFLFISHDRGAALLKPEFPVLEIPGPLTVYGAHGVDQAATLRRNLRFFLTAAAKIRRLLTIIDEFRPDAALCDYDFLVPRACRRVGVPCLGLDHQHVITACRHTLPLRLWGGYLSLFLIIRLLFSQAHRQLVISFFRPPLRPGVRAALAPPLLRDAVLSRRPREGEHILVYQSIPPAPDFFPFLQSLPHPVVLYGFNREAQQGNIYFKKTSATGFLDDLAACRAVICAGSHTLTSEALYYGKPVLARPFAGAFEQVLNAFYLEKLGYGLGVTARRLTRGHWLAFQDRLESCRQAIRQGDFFGNDQVFARVAEFIRTRGEVSW
jgi:uncharacterized protein (TIGR00661 family)